MKTPKQRVLRCIKFSLTLICALLFFAPFALTILNSVKPLGQIMTDLLGLPNEIAWNNYTNAWEKLNMAHTLLNTVIVTFATLAIIMLFSSMVAYWMIRHPSRYSKMLEVLLIGSILIPFASVMLPIVKMISFLGLNSTLWGGILTYSGMGLAFSTFIMTGAVRSIPVEIEEAAMIDGCNVYQVFSRIVLPMLRPTLLSVFILDLFWVWNDYNIALITLNSIELQTVQLAINKLFGLNANQWDIALPAIIMSITPIILINIFMQKKIIKGVAAGAIKG